MSETFYGLGIAPRLLEILDAQKFKTPTPIQFKAIPIAIEGKDIIGIAQTGTGKTLAFSVPMIQRLANSKNRGLVVLPTRELAIQVDEVLRKIGKSIGLRTTVLIGGTSIRPQVDSLRRRPHIIVGTPGRILDHMTQGTLTLNEVNILVLDEADHMLDMGFMPQITKILEKVPKNRQTLLFSATMPDRIVSLATKHMKLPLRVEIAPPGSVPERVAQELYVVERDQKLPLLATLLDTFKGSVLVFTRTKHGAQKITAVIRRLGHSAAEIHSNRSLQQRRMALDGFRSGQFRVLVATDIASRGIDVKNIELVINFDIPDDPSDYMHRIGRTARAGTAGRAITFATRDQKRAVKEIEYIMKSFIAISKLPELKSVPPAPYIPEEKNYSQSRPKRPGFPRRNTSSRPPFQKSFSRRPRQ